MTIRKSDWALGNKVAPVSREARGVVAELYQFLITEDVAAEDIIELAVLPAYHRIVSATLIPEGDLGEGVTANVGIMSGAIGENDDNRTMGTELFEGAALDKMSSLSKADAILVEPVEADRSIGVQFSGAVTAGDGDKVVSLVVFAVQ